MKKINGNCKAVRCLTNGKYYNSVKEAAADIGVHHSAVSFAIRKGGKCKGKEFGFVANMEKNIMKMASNLSTREICNEEMAEFYAWKAEKKAKEEKEKRIATLNAKVEHHREISTKAYEKWQSEIGKMSVLERELEDLTGDEVV